MGDNFLTEVAHSCELFVNIDSRPSNGDSPPIAAVPLVVSQELVGMLTFRPVTPPTTPKITVLITFNTIKRSMRNICNNGFTAT